MKYLVSVAPYKKKTEEGAEEFAAAGEPVVPWFPAPACNLFLSIISQARAQFAVVAEGAFDLDALAARLTKDYPGLPPALHENYVLETAFAAAQLPVGTMVKALIDDDSAALQVYNEAKVITLWTTQPIKKRPLNVTA